jgi:hypothetical protein
MPFCLLRRALEIQRLPIALGFCCPQILRRALDFPQELAAAKPPIYRNQIERQTILANQTRKDFHEKE